MSPASQASSPARDVVARCCLPPSPAVAGQNPHRDRRHHRSLLPSRGRCALILAASEEDSLRGEPPDADEQTPSPTFLEKLIDNMVRRIPGIEESGLQSIHVGRDGLTPTSAPSTAQRVLTVSISPAG
ncbi:MAG: hypothetical protein HND47_05905 [Chloroflexi bacterium]|nr:hypothetical protein [Chloroflexota bacterium]